MLSIQFTDAHKKSKPERTENEERKISILVEIEKLSNQLIKCKFLLAFRRLKWIKISVFVLLFLFILPPFVVIKVHPYTLNEKIL